MIYEQNIRTGQDVHAYAAGYNWVYQAGVDGYRFDKVEATVNGEWLNDFTREQAIEAHRAGYMESMAAVAEPFDEVQLENNEADVIRAADLKNGVTLVNVTKRMDPIVRTQLAVLQNFGKEKGISFVVVDDYSGRYALINGAQLGGTNKIIVSLDAEGATVDGKKTPLLLRTAAHEVYHYLEQETPEAARKMREFVVDHYVKEGKYENLAQQYAAQGLEDIDGELTADNLFDVMAQEGFLQKYAAEDARTVKTLRDTLAAFIRHINTALQKLTGTNPIHREIYESLTEDKKSLEKLRRMFNDALESVKNESSKPAANRTEVDTSDVKFSNKADSSIKEQLKENQDMLNQMEPVAIINEYPEFKSGEDVRKWVISKFKSIGFKVDRQGFGSIILDEKRVQNALRYYGTYEERVAFAAVPSVLKRGIVIDGHENHKSRAYDTVTFAAPVIINGTRGNMAVVVRNERKSYYKVHRIVMPDGSEFSFEQKNRDIAERAGRNNNSVLSPAANISANSISRGKAESQDKLSLKLVDPNASDKESAEQPVARTGKVYDFPGIRKSLERIEQKYNNRNLSNAGNAEAKVYDALKRLESVIEAEMQAVEDSRETDVLLTYRRKVRQMLRKVTTNGIDAKFSLKPASSIDEENRRLIEQNETYKAVIGKLNRQIAALQKKVADPKGVRKLARDVRAEYRSKIPQAELEQKLTDLFDYIANEQDLDFGEITRITAEIAKSVIEQSSALNTELTDQYKELRAPFFLCHFGGENGGESRKPYRKRK